MSKRYPGNFITGNPVALSQTSNNGVWDTKDIYTAVGNGTWIEPDGIYEIPRSLRFRKASSTYLNRTNATAGNRRRWTLSAWVKRGLIYSAAYQMFASRPSASPYSLIYFNSDGTFQMDDVGVCGFTTSALYRDPAAWYHLVIAIDTQKDAPSDRLRVWVNGAQQRFSASTFPSQNYQTQFNTASNHTIGKGGDYTAEYYDGQMAEVNFIDGQSLDPSYFGYFDTSSIWQPKKYTGTYSSGGYGANSFYLPFKDNDYLGMIGKDYAGTNEITYSSDFSQNSFVAAGVLTNQTTAPDGTLTADYIYPTATTANHYTYTTGKPFVAGPYTASWYVKYVNHRWISTQLYDGVANVEASFDLLNGVTGAVGSGVTSTMQAVGNGWYRITMTAVMQTGTGYHNVIFINNSDVVPYQSWAAAGTERVAVWGAQHNRGRTADPYMATSNTAKPSWTLNNFSLTAGVNYDSLSDSPTNVFTTATDVGGNVSGNYCTLNPLEGAFGNITLSDANLTLTSGGNSGYHNCGGTISPEGNKGYFEVICTNSPNGHLGVSAANPYYVNYAGSSGDAIYLSTDGSVYNIYTSTIKSGSITAPSTGDTIMIAFDFTDKTNKKLWFGRNGTWGLDASSNTGNPAAGTNATVTSTNLLSTLNFRWYFGLNNGAAFNFNFGQRAFTYTPPTGFGGVSTTTMQKTGTSSIGLAAFQANKYFDAVAYSGTGGIRQVKTPSGFAPDLVWLKGRSASSDNYLWDTTRGGGNANNVIFNRSNIEGYNSAYQDLTFLPDGFEVNQVSPGNEINYPTYGFVSWLWKASTAAGFTIISYTGTGTNNRAISHNLNATPAFIMVKSRDIAYNWDIYHQYLGVASTLIGASDTPRNYSAFGTTAPTTSNFYTQDNYTNTNNSKYIAYVWSEVPGFSKFGKYTGNGSSDGTFVYTGFRPKLIAVKNIGVAGSWDVHDLARDPQYNPSPTFLQWNTTIADYTYSGSNIDFLSNGFKFRGTDGDHNAGYNYVYIAFAESPFGLNTRAK